MENSFSSPLPPGPESGCPDTRNDKNDDDECRRRENDTDFNEDMEKMKKMWKKERESTDDDISC